MTHSTRREGFVFRSGEINRRDYESSYKIEMFAKQQDSGNAGKVRLGKKAS
jgi:hypothetical protein